MDRLFTYFYPIFWLISRLYFRTVNIAFNFVNHFIAKNAVDPIPTDGMGDLLKLSATKSAEMIRKGEITSSKLVQAYVNRIKQVNPQVNAVVTELFEEAIEIAENVDCYLANLDRESDEFKQLSRNKPLLGIPCTIKDNLKVKGCVSLAGNKMFLNNEPNSEDAVLVKRLRDAGAIPLATTNLPCFANGSEAHNVVTGRSRNPYDLRRSPGGSSGGESALIASAASLFGIGNDVGGSIRLPCYMCGIFGLKPSMDIVPVEGTILDPNSLTCARVNVNGPMCRYAEDLGLVLRALVGEEFATSTLNINRRIDTNNIKIFYMEELNNILAESMHPEPRAALRKAIGYCENKCGICAHRIDLPMAHRVFELFCAIVVSDDRLTGKTKSLLRRSALCIQKLGRYLLSGLDMAPIRLEFDLLSTMILDGPEKIHDVVSCALGRAQPAKCAPFLLEGGPFLGQRQPRFPL
ncbi:amidase domain-containing protein [Ditylenchus destructor]|uniref:Amidase domain-containing protein n=1 Tax=Ditylenchus destructor TaxID=166010 RepID=A0AAD4N4Z2_9BILA|nr:amidase domain-containing protein [Ditylenchus destructor]